MKEIIDTHDLSELSMKKIRQMLETEFKGKPCPQDARWFVFVLCKLSPLSHPTAVSLSKRKAWIKEEVDKLTAESDEDEEEEEEEEQPKKRQKKRDSRFGSLLSPEMQAFLGVEEMDRRSVVKELWKYIKENNLQDPKNKRKIMLDEKLSTIFKVRHCPPPLPRPASPADDATGPPRSSRLAAWDI